MEKTAARNVVNDIEKEPKNRAEQVIYVFKRFLIFLCAANGTQEKTAALMEKIGSIPTEYLLAKAVDLNDKYGERVCARDSKALLMLLMDLSQEENADSMISETRQFLAKMESEENKEMKESFYRYFKVLRQLCTV